MSGRGCLVNAFFAVVLFVAFGFSTYVWFNFFVRGKSLPTPNLIGKSVSDARAICQDLGLDQPGTPRLRNRCSRFEQQSCCTLAVWVNRTSCLSRHLPASGFSAQRPRMLDRNVANRMPLWD